MTKMSHVEQLRRFMPRQFTKMLKLCAKCGARVQWDEPKRRTVCPRCKAEY